MKLVFSSFHRAARVPLAALLFTAACHGGSGSGGAGGADAGPPPPDCSAGCPTGYACTDGVCTGGDAQKIAFDVKTFPVSGKLTLDGHAPTADTSSCSNGQVAIDFVSGPPRTSFFGPILGSEVSAYIDCAATDGSFATRLPAGKYRVLARQYDSSSSFPQDTFVVQGAFEVTGPAANLAWNLTSVPVSGKLTLDGKAPVADTSSCSNGQVAIDLTDDNGAAFSAYIDCGSTDGSFSTRVAPGTYRVLARQYDSSSSFPQDTFVVQTGFAVTGAKSGLAWKLTTVPVSGKLTLDGKAPVADTSSCSNGQVAIDLTNDDGAAFSAYIDCGSTDGSFSTRVAPGTYRVLARQYDNSSSFPQDTFVVQPSFAVTAAKSGLAWKLTSVPVSGKLTLDGKAPVADTSSCSNGQVAIDLTDDNGAAFSAYIDCGSTDGSFSTRVAPGTYRVLARQYDSSSSFPQDTFVVQPSFAVTAAKSGLAWKLTTVPVAGTLKVDGMAPVADTSSCSNGQVAIDLTDDNGAIFSAYIDCASTNGSFSTRTAPGTYRFVARRYDSSSSFPDATFNLQDAISVP